MSVEPVWHLGGGACEVPETFFAKVSTSGKKPAENQLVQFPITSEGDPRRASAAMTSVAPASFFGLSPEVFDRAWTIDNIRDYLQIGRTQVYALAKRAQLPAPTADGMFPPVERPAGDGLDSPRGLASHGPRGADRCA
jgi:hypothetical protein